MVTRLDLVVVNVGDKPTFSRGNAESIIDLTLVSQQVARRISGWKVLAKESLSDHSYIIFHLEGNVAQRVDIQVDCRPIFWNAKKIDSTAFEEALEEMKLLKSFNCHRQLAPIAARINSATREIVKVCDRCVPRRRPNTYKHRAKYWWNDEIVNLRKDCLIAKRRATRSRGDQVLIGLQNGKAESKEGHPKKQGEEMA